MDVLRLDLIHPEISGNKWFKLKRNLDAALAEKVNTIITFGGTFSNHIAATAAAARLYGLRSVAVVRGEKPDQPNPTLAGAIKNGMELYFVSRERYAQKDEDDFKTQLTQAFGKHYLIPEGGNNEQGALGSMDILKAGWDHDYIFCACGTGTTFAGLAAAANPEQSVIGISVLKGENILPGTATELLNIIFPDKKITCGGDEAFEDLKPGTHGITNAYCFSGYAKFDRACVEFKRSFETKHQVPLDHIYTSKLFYAVDDLVKTDRIPKGSKLLIIHSGGLQGNAGFEERYHLRLSL